MTGEEILLWATLGFVVIMLILIFVLVFWNL
jgi:hypothetical protein